jgi:hypothetical protein
LNGVLWIVKNKLSDAKVLEFDAWNKGEGDSKIIKGLDVNKPLRELDYYMVDIEDQLKDIEPIEIPPTERRIELSKKFGTQLKKLYDIDKEQILVLFTNLRKAIADKDLVQTFQIISTLSHLIDGNPSLKNRIKHIDDLYNSLGKYRDALVSHTETGLIKNKNRRAGLYAKIVQRYFSNEYDVEIYGDHFTLVKK